MTKVAFYITSEGWGGLEMNTLKIAASLMKRNYEVCIYTTRLTKFCEKALENNIPVITISQPKRYIDIRSAYLISSFLKKNGHNIIFLSYNKDIEVIAQCKRLFYPSLKIIYQQHMQVSINKKDIFHRMRYSYINYWISPLNSLKQQVIEKTTVTEKKIRVINIGTETEKYLTRKYTKEEARRALGIKCSGLLIGIIGRFDPKKGQDFLIRALIELRKRNIYADLLIFGILALNVDANKKYYYELKELVKTNGAENICHFRENYEDENLFYNAIDIFALASQAETYGMVTIEAMLSGVPIIATNSGGTPELLNNGEYGSLYNINDITDFCNQFIKIINNPDISSSKTEIAKKHAFETYSLESEVNKIDELITELVSDN